MQILNGKYYADQILTKLKLEVQKLPPIKLAIILAGDNPASEIYVSNKISKAEEIGITTELIKMPPTISETELLNTIDQLNKDPFVKGIIVQLPLPKHINKTNIQESINPIKDIDGFHPLNVGKLYLGITNGLIPCTPQGCMHLIKIVKPNLKSAHAVILGRSQIVGRPMAELLLKEDATVTIAHSKTTNLAMITSNADIVISAMGKPLFLNKNHFKKNAIVIDVGITRLDNGNVVGDVDFDNVQNAELEAITPVPGGIGPMTVAYLLSNLVKAAQNG